MVEWDKRIQKMIFTILNRIRLSVFGRRWDWWNSEIKLNEYDESVLDNSNKLRAQNSLLWISIRSIFINEYLTIPPNGRTDLLELLVR